MSGLSRAEIFGITVFSFLAVIWLGQVTYGSINHGSALKKQGDEKPVQEVPVIIFVQVAGAIKKPGILKMPAGSRVSDAMKLAGGAADNADISLLNLAESLVDGQKIYVPFKGEMSPAASQKVETKPASHATEKSKMKSPINLNTATKEELITLPGIGDVRAGDIITYRTQHGGFKKKEEVMNVKGIGKGIYAQIKDLIYV